MDIQKADRILKSLNGLKKAEAPDFFYTRLKGRMQLELVPESRPFLRPVWLSTTLVLLLLVNVFSVLKLNHPDVKLKDQSVEKPASLESFADAYNLNTTSVYE